MMMPYNPNNLFNLIPTDGGRLEFQIKRWAAGQSLHNHIDNCCCPDFSCCHPELQASKECINRFLLAAHNRDYLLVKEMTDNFEAAYKGINGIQYFFESCPENLNAYH